MEFEPYKALYLHIPFCQKCCRYCDFSTKALPPDSPEIETYVDKLIIDLKRASRLGLLGSIETVYIGGGTPTYLGNKQLSRLLYALSLFVNLSPEMECTLEANPESLTEAMVKDSFALGMTRLSLGVQSFDNDVLSFLGRVHTAQKAREALQAAAHRFQNISIDLMCGIPGQTQDSFQETLEEAVRFGVKHISVYPLTLEEGTPLYAQWRTGAFTYDEDEGADMMKQAQSYLETQGYKRYEVASYARAGYESKHNSAYWSAKSYLGLGTAAVSMKQNDQVRIREQEGHVLETLTYSQRIAEDLMLGMRMTRGVSAELCAVAAKVLPDSIEVFHSLEHKGLAVADNGGYRPTEKGWLFGNVMYGELLALAP